MAVISIDDMVVHDDVMVTRNFTRVLFHSKPMFVRFRRWVSVKQIVWFFSDLICIWNTN